MGADLYIEELEEKYREKNKAPFDNAVKGRDIHFEEHKCKRIYDQKTSDLDREKTCHVYLQHQDAVDEASKALWEDNPYYFRDSYNFSSVMWRLGLSWWQNDFIDEEGNITPKNAAKFIKLLESREVTTKDMSKHDEKWWGGLSEEERAEWVDYWKKKRLKLIDFLKLAIKEGKNINASV